MRKSREETAQTRERIIAVAAEEFRRTGIVATGIADLMAAAGLTNGGFYRHFESKDQLIAEASAAALASLDDRLTTAIANKNGPEGLETIVEIYLSTFHRDNPQAGCFIGSVGSELARAEMPTREIVTTGFLNLVDMIAAQLTEREPAEAKRQAMLTLFTMIGAITMSRIVTDGALSDSILQTAIDSLTATNP